MTDLITGFTVDVNAVVHATDVNLSTPSLVYNLDHDGFSGFVLDEHIAHSGVTIVAGGILSGGGTIAANRTISLANSDIDHGSISGLDGDDHTQYHNDSRAQTWLDGNHNTSYDHNDISLNTTHRTSNGTDHSYLDQDVTTTSNPDFNGIDVNDVINVGDVNISSPSLIYGLSHNSFADLTTGDPHTQYPLLAGRAGGQTLYGGNAANDDITIEGTSHATKTTSYVLLNPSGGNVGIGTSSPGMSLDVYGTVGIGANSYDNADLNFWGNGVRNLISISRSDNTQIGYLRTNGWGDFIFSRSLGIGYDISNQATASNLLVNGKVGIGTSSPQSILDIQAPSSALKLTSTTGTNSAYIKIINTAGDFYIGRDTSTAGLFGGSAYASALFSTGAYPMEFWTNSARRMSITSSGNIGINTSTFGTSAAKVLAIGNGTAPSSSPADCVQIYAEDVSSSSELKVRDEAGNITVLSANVEEYPEDMEPSKTYPYVTMHENVYLGTTTYIAQARMAELVQELAWKAKLLDKDKYIIKHVPMDPSRIEDWDKEQLDWADKYVQEVNEYNIQMESLRMRIADANDANDLAELKKERDDKKKPEQKIKIRPKWLKKAG